jgi:hypothetical protein
MIIKSPANSLKSILAVGSIHKRKHCHRPGHVGFHIWIDFKRSLEEALDLRCYGGLLCGYRGTPEGHENAQCKAQKGEYGSPERHVPAALVTTITDGILRTRIVFVP